MGFFILFVLYQIVQIVLLPLVFFYIIFRKVKKKLVFGNFIQRAGFVPKVQDGKKSIWIHAVSVGEVLSIQGLVKEFKQRFPNHVCYLTVGTLAGEKVAQKQVNADHISFLPYDLLPSMLLAFKRINPSMVVLIEAEIWPNFLMLAKLKKVPMYLLNARVSKRSGERLTRFKTIFAPLFNVFTHIYAQSNDDTVFLQKHLNIREDKLTVLGNIKAFNVLPKKKMAAEIMGGIKVAMDASKTFPILLVGSVHAGELDHYLTLFEKLKKEVPNLKMILAPRHFHWKDELVKKVEATKSSYFLWDEHTQGLRDERLIVHEIVQTILPNKDIMLVCTMGKLFYLYAVADIFFLGGTFVPVGGHNLLEPAVWGKPSIVGPYHANCQSIADQLQQRNALIKVGNQNELEQQVLYLLNHNKIRSKMGSSAADWLEEQAGSVQMHLENFFEKCLKDL